MSAQKDGAPVIPPIILEDKDFLIASKPPGMETVSQEGRRELARLLREERDEPGLTPVHRLDRDTSGAQLFARNAAAEKILTALFRKREVSKAYLALCLGVPRNRQGRINRPLSEWEGGRRPVRAVKSGGKNGALEASTSYRVIGESKEALFGQNNRNENQPAGSQSAPLKISFIAFSPHQGRTHQIRVHAAALGYPVLGDDQYGDRAANKKAKEIFGLARQALHSWRLEFTWRSEAFRAIAPLFPDMERVLREGFSGMSEPSPDALFAEEARS